MARDLSFLDSLKGKRVLLTFHSLGDADGVGAAFALKRYLGNSTVVPVDRITSLAKKLINHVGFALDKPGSYDALVILDCNSRMLMGQFADAKAFGIIDHHSAHSDPIRAKNKFIDPDYSSTCEIVYEYLRERQESIDHRVAFLLAAGIVLDSANFKNSHQRTFKYMSELLSHAQVEYDELLEFLDVPKNISQRMAVLKACQRTELKRTGDYLIATSRVNSFEAVAAESLLTLGADVSFVGYAGKDARISARTHIRLAPRLNLTDIMAQAGKILGGSGGGHPCAAGATGARKAKLKEALALCTKLAAERLGG